VKDGRGDISIRSHVALTHILNAARIEIVVLGLLTINSSNQIKSNLLKTEGPDGH